MFSSFKEDLLLELKQFNKEKYSLSNYFESKINIYINNNKDTLCIDGKAYLSNSGTIITTLDSYVFDDNTNILNITVLQSKSPSIQTIKRISFKNYVYLKNKMAHPYMIIFIINGKKTDNVTVQPSTEYMLLHDCLIKYYVPQITTTTSITSTTSTTTTTTTIITTQSITTTTTILTPTTTTSPTTTTQHSTSITINSTNTSVREIPINNIILLGVLLFIIILIIIITAKKK